MIVGIDLGTTYSLVAALREGEVSIIANAFGQHLTPSAVALTDADEIVVGAAALALSTTHPERAVLAWKRDMGTDRTWQLGRRRFTPQELSALVLASLKADAEKALGMPVDEAVVTVPAYFDEAQRRATRDAGAIAGLRVDRIINEPTAAALSYGLHQRGRELRAVVLDLGGGTFDVTVLEIIDGVVEIQASAGDARLGGEDFSDALAADVAVRIGVTPGVLQGRLISWARLRAACEGAKRTLSAADQARIVVPDLDVGGRLVNVDQIVTRPEVEQLWRPIIDRMRKPIARALRDAEVQPAKIDEVLLVGGSTRMPCVIRAAAELFGRMPSRNLPADEAVAMGAAVQAALKEGDAAVDDLVVTDIAPFTLGIAVASRFGQQHIAGVFAPIIERGTVIPASRVKAFSTVTDNQREILIEVYQGEHATCEQNKKLGQYNLTGLPRGPAGSESVDVRFSYDMNGLLEVEMMLPKTGRKETLVIEQTPGRLTAAQIAASRRDLQRLKFHPREALPNTTALARADSLYVELRGPVREQLGEAIAGFRAVLDGQDPQQIEATRAQLLAIIDSVG